MIPTILDFKGDNYFIRQLYTSCLAEACYFIESGNEAAIVDPLRDPHVYTNLLKERGSKLKYVFLTHFHADFISGHADLARQTGATIVYGPTAVAEGLNIEIAKDGEEIVLGNIKIVVLHTPGHTMESSCFLVVDKEKPLYVITGDTLFLGEVGRPDLAVKGDDLTQEDLASYLFDSLHNKILTLPEDVIVLPGHGAGSPCGKSIQAGTHDTIANQKKTNYALLIKEKSEFVKTLCSEIPQPPSYFFHDAAMNKRNVPSIDEIVKNNKIPLSPEQFDQYLKDGCVGIDTRFKNTFVKGFIHGTVNLDSSNLQFGLWVGKLFEPDQKFVFVCDEGKEDEIIIRMSRLGYDIVLGYLQGGIAAWEQTGRPLDGGEIVTMDKFHCIDFSQSYTLDVRAVAERVNGYIDGSYCIPLDSLYETLKSESHSIPKDKTIYVYCRSGARGTTALSILKKHGFKNVINIDGGVAALIQANHDLKYAQCSKSGK